MNNSFDVIIVGAGPGGACCALNLAHSGLKVALLDKSEFPRDKVCGDALSGKVLSALKYTDPDLETALHKFAPQLGSHGIRFFAPSGQWLDIPFQSAKENPSPYPPGYICRRWDFDNFLFQKAAALPNVKTITGFNLKKIEQTPEVITVSDGKQKLQGKMLIGADGVHSVVAKKLAGHKLDKAHHSGGIRAYYSGVTGFHSQNFIELHFIKNLLPGYFWIFPLPNGSANVGLGMLTKDISAQKVNLKKLMTELIANHPLIAPRFKNAKLEGKIQGMGLGLGSKKRPLSGERFMLIGDAASLIDPFSGEGIGNAMLSGRLAAQQAMRCFEENNFGAEFMLNYDQAIWKKMWAELSLSHRMQKLVDYPSLFNFVVRKANKSKSLQSMFTMMFEDVDIRKQLSKPSFYLKILFNR